MATQATLTDAPLKDMDEWDDFLTGRYQEGKSEDQFRQYDATATPGVADDAPLGLAPKAKDLPEIVDETGEDEPAGMAVFADGFRGLEEVLDLGEIGVGIAFIDQGVEILGCLPDALLTFVEGEVLFFFGDDEVEGLEFVVVAVEGGDGRHDGRIIVTKLGLTFAFAVSARDKV